MRSKFLFRESGSVIPTRPRMSEGAIALLLALAMAAIFALAFTLDEPPPVDALADAQSYAAGRRAAREELSASIAAAYQQGRREAIATACGEPQ